MERMPCRENSKTAPFDEARAMRDPKIISDIVRKLRAMVFERRLRNPFLTQSRMG
jgi:hypothetical protein